MDICKEKYPPSIEIDGGGFASCWLLNENV
jgi:hypothetical protein